MQDLLILIPGIMGSVLTRDGKALWEPGLGMAKNLLSSRRWVESLAVSDADDPGDTAWLDGVIPTGLAQSHTIVPGLLGIDGYTQLHNALIETFPNLVEGDPLRPARRVDGRPSSTSAVPNYYQFAYDWRRDIRANSLRLHNLVDEALPALRDQRSPQARVIIVAHSMGGLVARYYMYGINPQTAEPFEGWRYVRELFTMGTPYRGSVDAFHHLTSRFRKIFVDFSEALRTFQGVYQLLPRYRVAWDERGTAGGWRYPHEITGIDGFSPDRARDARDIYVLMDDRAEGLTATTHGQLVPNIGFGHKTWNSVVVTSDGIEMSPSIPTYLDPILGGGDGTVPVVSAIPPEMNDNRAPLRYTNQRHGSLQVDHRLLSREIRRRLAHAQAGTLDALDPVNTTDPTELPGLSVSGPNYFLDGQRPFVDLDVTGVDTTVPLKVTVRNLETNHRVGETLDAAAGETVVLPSEPGEYRIEVAHSSPRLESEAFYTVL